MGYGQYKEDPAKQASIIALNAGTTAAALLAPFASNYESVHDLLEDFDTVRERVFQGTFALSGAGTVIETFSAPTGGGSTETSSTPSGGGRPHADVEVKFGKYRGKTIQEIADLGDDGMGWLEWAGENASNDFIKSRVK